MPDQLLYHILNSDKKTQYLNLVKNVETGEGVLKNDGTPAHLKQSPTGWRETLIKFVRNNKYLGLFRDLSVPLNFPGDGAKILRNAMWRFGMEAIYYLTISKLNQNIFPDTYESWYAGELDFSKFKQTRTGVDIQLVEGGISKLLKAYESTTFEIDIHNDVNKFDLYMDGLTFQNKIESTVYNQVVGQFVGGSNVWMVGTGIITNEGTTQGIVSNDQNQVPGPVIDGLSDFFQCFTKTGVLHISGTIPVFGFDPGFATEAEFKLSFRKSGALGVFISEYLIVPTQIIHNGQDLTATFSFNIPFEPGITIGLYANTDPGGILARTFVILGEGNFKYDYLVRFDPTLCECMSWMNLFERLTYKLTGGKYGCKSTFLPTLTDQCVTSGQSIRQYRSESVIKTSMDDFFKSCKRWGVGLGIENNQLVIEKHEYFFKSGIAILNLGDVIDFEVSVAEDLVFNTIKVGYLNQTYDNVNGKDEFNVTQQYTTPHTRVVKELDLVCPFRADMFGIELTRIRLYLKDSTDNKADNDTFIMNVVKGTDYDYYRGTFNTFVTAGQYFVNIPTVLFDLPIGKVIRFNSTNHTIVSYNHTVAGITTIRVNETIAAASYNEAIVTHDDAVYKLNRPVFSSITGLVNPTEAFNVLLNPKSIIDNNSAYIHSVLDLQDAGKITFQSGEKNSLMSYTLLGKTVTQNADIPINGLPTKLFKPYYFHFKTKVPLSLPALMKTNPYDKVSFTYNGYTLSGFIWEAGIAPATNAAQEFQLLCSPDTDLTKLI